MTRCILPALIAGVALAGSAFAHHPKPIPVVPVPVYAPPPVIVHRPPVFIPAEPAYCLDTFVRDFRPVEGHHRITVIHPVTKCPVDVCFDLPCGKLKEFEVNHRSIEFDYGKKCVRIVFRLNGSVDVRD